MKHILTVLSCLLSAVCASAAEPSNPNIVFVLTDDQGYGDLGCTGNPIIQTPHIDSLAAESSQLTDYHVAPTCSPTRAALLTGHGTDRTGVWHTVNGRSMLRENELDLYAGQDKAIAAFFGMITLAPVFTTAAGDEVGAYYTVVKAVRSGSTAGSAAFRRFVGLTRHKVIWRTMSCWSQHASSKQHSSYLLSRCSSPPSPASRLGARRAAPTSCLSWWTTNRPLT